MDIQNDSRKIVHHFLEKVIEFGDFQAQFTFQFDALAAELGLQSGNYCRVCCQYLRKSGYVSIYSADTKGPDGKDLRITIEPKAVDFLESPYTRNSI